MINFLQSRRALFWVCFSIGTICALMVLLSPSGPQPQPVPPAVKLRGVSRPEAEFLYGCHQWEIHHRFWRSLTHFQFYEAKQALAAWRYSHVESITQTASNASTLVITYTFPGKPPTAHEERTQYTPFSKRHRD